MRRMSDHSKANRFDRANKAINSARKIGGIAAAALIAIPLVAKKLKR